MTDLDPVYIVSSDHPVLVDRMLATVRESAVPASMRAWNYDVIEGKTTANRVITTCQTLPMMGALRMVLIRDLAAKGTTVIFSTHVIAHAERLCDSVAIIAGGKVPYAGSVDAARDRIPPQVRLETRNPDGPWRAALPAEARKEGSFWYFPLPDSGVEPLLRGLIEGDAGIQSLQIERAGLHDAFVAIAGEAAARALETEEAEA